MPDGLHHIAVGARAFKNGNYRIAGRMFLKACKEAEASPGSDSLVLIGCYYNLALFYYKQHQYRKADITLSRALKMLQDSHYEPLATTLEIKITSLLIDVLKTQGNYRRALKICKRTIESINTQQSTTCSAAHLPVFDRLISLLLITNTAKSAEKWLQQAIDDETSKDCPDKRAHIGAWSSRLAWLYCYRGMVDAASQVLNQRFKQCQPKTNEV